MGYARTGLIRARVTRTRGGEQGTGAVRPGHCTERAQGRGGVGGNMNGMKMRPPTLFIEPLGSRRVQG